MKYSLTASLVLLLSFMMSACQSVQIPVQTFTPGPTSTQDITPTLKITPTITPIPSFTPSPLPTTIGGSEHILIQTGLFDNPKIYLYNIKTRKAKLLLDDFRIASVSSDGKKMIVYKLREGDLYDSLADLFLVYFDKPEPIFISDVFRISLMRQLGKISAGWIHGRDTILFTGGEDVIQVFSYEENGITTQLTNTDIGIVLFDLNLVDNGVCWVEGTLYYLSGIQWTSIDDLQTTKNPKCGELYGYLSGEVKTESLDINRFISSIPENYKVDFDPNGPVYSPDGEKQIIWLTYCDSNCYNDNNFYVLSKEGEIVRKISLSDGEVDTRWGNEFIFALKESSFSPDGKNLVLQFRRRDENFDPIIQNYIVNLETGILESLTFDLPDDTHISYFYWLP